ncbi:hypothetical protein AURDEDRAFT_175546 [Auricularia subglabra TFB-10046 SS5]|uniref:Uncharacterized protein n=1 Tax=Auricularia subglabra (strain TFB-10046 / SS5) TaxID=717982 RepID=J0WT42_AURST|nr:hypothetical protein AURDEDRAFT_175546 [Auricularia subglabra TFB-10046 SS5]
MSTHPAVLADMAVNRTKRARSQSPDDGAREPKRPAKVVKRMPTLTPLPEPTPMPARGTPRQWLAAAKTAARKLLNTRHIRAFQMPEFDDQTVAVEERGVEVRCRHCDRDLVLPAPFWQYGDRLKQHLLECAQAKAAPTSDTEDDSERDQSSEDNKENCA